MRGQRYYRDFYENIERKFDKNTFGSNFSLQCGSHVSGIRGTVKDLPGNNCVNFCTINVATRGDTSSKANVKGRSSNGSPRELNNTARSTMNMSNGNTCGATEALNTINNFTKGRGNHTTFQNNLKPTNSNQSIYHNFNRKKRSSFEDNYSSNRVKEVFTNPRRFNCPAWFDAPEPRELTMPPVQWLSPRRTDKLEEVGNPHFEMSQLFLTSPRKRCSTPKLVREGEIICELDDMVKMEDSHYGLSQKLELEGKVIVINNSKEVEQSDSSEQENHTEDDASSYASALEFNDDDSVEPVSDAEIRDLIMTNFEPKEVLSADERAVIGAELEQALHGAANDLKEKVRMAFNKSISYIEEKTLTACMNGSTKACSKIINDAQANKQESE